MRAVIVRGLGEVAVASVEVVRIPRATDALFRVTSSAICGTDLHDYGGRAGDAASMVIGRERLGVVELAGSAVVSIQRGDCVTVPTCARPRGPSHRTARHRRRLLARLAA
jgi:S-(hydroxymethyl)glutathione dehydrogenase/alcohol dehydrogenase